MDFQLGKASWSSWDARQGKAKAVSLLGEAEQDNRCSSLLVKCDNTPETVNMKVSNEAGVSVTVAARAAGAAIGMSQGRRIPRRDRDSEAEAEARQRQFLWGRCKPMKYRASCHEAEPSKFSASRQPRVEASATRTTSLQITQVDLYNDCKMVVVFAAVFSTINLLFLCSLICLAKASTR